MSSKNKEETKYPTEKLLKSKAFAGYQQDFMRAILKDSEYSTEEAKRLLKDIEPKGGN